MSAEQKPLNCYTKLTMRGSAKVSRWENWWTRERVFNDKGVQTGWDWFWTTAATFSVVVDTVSVKCICLVANAEQAADMGDAQSSISNIVAGPNAGRRYLHRGTTFDFQLVDFFPVRKICKTFPDGTTNPKSKPSNGTMCVGSAEGGSCSFSAMVSTSDGHSNDTNVGAQNQSGSLDIAWDDAMDELVGGLFGYTAQGGSVGPPPGWCGLDGYVDCGRWDEDTLPNPGVNSSNSTTGNDSRGGWGNPRRTDTVMTRRW